MHLTDPYVRQAQAKGYRSRAAFKLLGIDEKDKLIKPGMTVVDLGSTPGSWSQVVREILSVKRAGESSKRVHGRILALDILPMEPIADVDFIEGDFREDSVAKILSDRLGGEKVDLVLSDMAPNLSGVPAIDQPSSLYLCELALDLANRALKPGGDVLIKTFQGSGFDVFVAEARKHYTRVKFAKPAASRSRSPELYLLARGRKAV